VTKGDWIYCGVVISDALIFPRKPYWFGHVEFSPLDWDDDECTKQRRISQESFGIEEGAEAPYKSWRARTTRYNETVDEAKRTGSAVVRETVGLFVEHCLSGLTKLSATDAGYLLAIKTGGVTPLRPPYEPGRFPSMSFAFLDVRAKQPDHILNVILVTERHTYGELGEAVRRSFHWRTLAESAADKGERFMLAWMSSECLCRANRDETNVQHKMAAAAGFPRGERALALNSAEVNQLSKSIEYRTWKKVVHDAFEKLREARNNITHSGFRQLDLSDDLDPFELRFADRILPMVSKCLVDMALLAIAAGARTVAQMWDRYPRDLNPSGLLQHTRWFMDRFRALQNGD